jgi:hypothetical protein
VAKKFPLHPAHPERICWGCDRYCSTDSLACGNGSDRTMPPAEMLGEDWYLFGDWGIDPESETNVETNVETIPMTNIEKNVNTNVETKQPPDQQH